MIRAKQNLKFLQRVLVKRWASIGYDEKGERDVEREAWSQPRLAFVIGKKRKALGTYQKGFRSYGFMEPGEDVQASLKVTEYIELWEVKPSLSAPSYLVHDEDLEPCPSRKTTKPNSAPPTRPSNASPTTGGES